MGHSPDQVAAARPGQNHASHAEQRPEARESFLYIMDFALMYEKTRESMLFEGVPTMTKRLIPLAAMDRILKNGGADRVSDKAKAALKSVLEDIAEEIAANAVKLAIHAGRKTVKAGDIKLAAR